MMTFAQLHAIVDTVKDYEMKRILRNTLNEIEFSTTEKIRKGIEDMVSVANSMTGQNNFEGR